jgi:hypothetical protein
MIEQTLGHIHCGQARLLRLAFQGHNEFMRRTTFRESQVETNAP